MSTGLCRLFTRGNSTFALFILRVFTVVVVFVSLSLSFHTGSGEPDENRRNGENNKGKI